MLNIYIFHFYELEICLQTLESEKSLKHSLLFFLFLLFSLFLFNLKEKEKKVMCLLYNVGIKYIHHSVLLQFWSFLDTKRIICIRRALSSASLQGFLYPIWKLIISSYFL